MKAFLGICLFLSITGPGEPLQCKECTTSILNPSRCQNVIKSRCQANYPLCYSAVLRSNIFRRKLDAKYAECIKPQPIIGDYSIMAAKNKYFQMVSYTCNTDYCNTFPEVPDHEELPFNGLQCPACYKVNSEKCEITETVSCRQNENKCIDFHGELKFLLAEGKNITLKGCSTKDFCKLPKGLNFLYSNDMAVTVNKNQCSDAQESSYELGPEE